MKKWEGGLEIIFASVRSPSPSPKKIPKELLLGRFGWNFHWSFHRYWITEPPMDSLIGVDLDQPESPDPEIGQCYDDFLSFFCWMSTICDVDLFHVVVIRKQIDPIGEIAGSRNRLTEQGVLLSASKCATRSCFTKITFLKDKDAIFIFTYYTVYVM